MPFLRAALLKKKAIREQEEEKFIQPVIVVDEPEPEPEEFPDINKLLRVIDEKVEQEKAQEKAAEAKENEIAELDEGHTDDIAEPEVVSVVDEDIHVHETDSDIEIHSEVQEQEEEPEQQEHQEPEIEQESESEQESEQEAEIEAEPKQEPELSEPESEIEQEPELSEPENESQQKTEIESEIESESQQKTELSEPEPEPEQDVSEAEIEPETTSKKDYSGETLNYDFTSGKRYVDLVSTKTDFDRMLDELSAISGDLLSHEVEKFAKKFTDKFQGDFDKAESDAKKYEAFLGGYITNAAMILYDNGYRDAAIKQLEQAKSILEARKKLEDETAAIKTRVEEENDSVDLSDLLGLFGD